MANKGKIKLGIIREGKIPIDRRVPLSPQQCVEVIEKFPEVEVAVQSSHIRCYKDSEYREAGFSPKESLEDCDILLGVKEVPVGDLIPMKTYLFFSHTIKKQDYNRTLLRTVMSRKIRLIDYETLTNKKGVRLIAFGRYAGLVGAYNGILHYGKKSGLYDLNPANKCFDMDEMIGEYPKVKLPADTKIVITGGGRVARGAMEVLDGMKITKVNAQEFLEQSFDYPVYTQLNSIDYNKRKDGGEFKNPDFYSKPEEFEGDFMKYAKTANILIACAYWDPKAPKLFSKEDMRGADFNISLVADITCDIDGSIPSTKRPSTIDNPAYDYNPETEKIEPAYASPKNVTVMAVDNLPCELPRNASVDFGKELLNNILPSLIRDDSEEIIKRATITENGKLTDEYAYLQDYVDGKE